MNHPVLIGSHQILLSTGEMSTRLVDKRLVRATGTVEQRTFWNPINSGRFRKKKNLVSEWSLGESHGIIGPSLAFDSFAIR